ncbi:dehydrogenase [Acuticoccus sediminis]|uniref:Dehydrogenase n=2 Tax=Acuticoccus sediminis TaxID=2184697 RepID=A0A8B2NM52_9HYPH|nr:dehydrogenase [Acuticoccus sediminis]
MLLSGRSAIVTGAAKGIGRACAEALAAEGAKVAVTDIDLEAARATAASIGGDAVAIHCDVADDASVAAMLDAAIVALGPISVLVNNAGIAIGKPFLDLEVADFEKVLAVNLTGTFRTTQAVARHMVAEGIKGSIVNMSSINAVVAIPAIAAYCASKGGVAQLTKASALALIDHGIRVNAVGPGSILTDMMKGVAASEEAMRMVMSRTPIHRLGQPSEIGDVVTFLASDKSSYITGETIFVDGGRLALNYTV